MLSHLRVIDLTDAGAAIGGQILADLGADVVLIEPPGGAHTRQLGPFAEDVRDPERSLEFWSVHRGKRSLVADHTTQSGRESLRELARSADVWLDDWRPGQGAALGLDYEDLRGINPALIHVSITPFGEVGPKTAWAATDLTVSASTMTMTISGDEDRAPLSCSVPQAFLQAGSEAATAALLALTERERSGLGQHVDVSAQASMMISTQCTVLSHGWNDGQVHRVGGGLSSGKYRIRFVYQCADGYVNLTFLFGHLGEPTTRFVDWMYEAEACTEEMHNENWIEYGLRLEAGDVSVADHEATMDQIEGFTRSKTKAELFDAAFERKLLIVPLSDGLDLHHSKQLAARDYWTPLRHPKLDREVTYPGPFAKFSATPIRYRRPPPGLGEHTDEVLSETPRPRTPITSGDSSSEAPLDGLRVLDFTWVFAGPSITRVLADYGATVIKVESPSKPDNLRHGNPFLDGVPGSERSGQFCNMNAGKLSLGLNLKTPQAREVVLRLVDWADVVVENFSPRGMKSLSLDYETLRVRKPELVMLSSCLAGQTGPESLLAGYGTMGAALAGFGYLTGWPDRAPSGPFLAYTDYVAPRFALSALLAALDHMRRTGEGQHIDCSQNEAAMHMLGPAILEPSVNGRVVSARGNACPHYSPSGVYPVRGDDRWVAIAAPDDEVWRSLAAYAGQGWGDDDRFSSPLARLANTEELDTAIAVWTAGQEVERLEDELQARNVPVHRLSLSRDCFEDPQLVARRHFVDLDHGLMGPVPHESSRMRFSRTPARVERAGPMLGADNATVLSEILAFSEDEITELVIAGAIE